MTSDKQVKQDGKSQRLRERLAPALPVRVRCRETRDHEWMEVSRLIDVTPFGRDSRSRTRRSKVEFCNSRCRYRALRCFDHTEDQYRVWSLVRFVKCEATKTPDAALRFEIGVAFIGKHPPPSYTEDPATRYEILAPGSSGLWQLREVSQVSRPRYVSPNEPRPETRVNLPLEVTIELQDANGRTVMSENTVTENVSRRGAAIFTNLQVERGRFVRLTSRMHNMSLVAVVRGRRVGANGIPRLHLEFIDRQFPLDGLN